MTKAEFWDKVPVAAGLAADLLGVDRDLITAQAALESGWGKHMPRCKDGSYSWNLFGIKAGKTWAGAVAEEDTREWSHGKYVTVKARFRAYPTLAAGFRGYADFIRSNLRYKIPINPTPEQYLDALVAGGYATDPGYKEKVLGIYRQLKKSGEVVP